MGSALAIAQSRVRESNGQGKKLVTPKNQTPPDVKDFKAAVGNGGSSRRVTPSALILVASFVSSAALYDYTVGAYTEHTVDNAAKSVPNAQPSVTPTASEGFINAVDDIVLPSKRILSTMTPTEKIDSQAFSFTS